MSKKRSDPPPGQTTSQVCVVDEELHGVLLGDYLLRRWPLVDRVFLRNLVLQDRVEVNGDISELGHCLRAGDVVILELPGSAKDLPIFDAPEAEFEVPVLYEDSEVLVVDKPAGIAGAPDRGGKYPGVQGILQATRPGLTLRMLGRREVDVSGCTMFTKSLDVQKRLEDAYQSQPGSAPDQPWREEYLALVNGVLSVASQRVERAIGPDTRRPGRITVVGRNSKGARVAVSQVSLEEPFRAHSLVRVVPETSRSHQVRVHLSHLGYPVVADKDYGVRDNLLLSEIKRGYKTRPGVVERPLLNRMFIHIAGISWSESDGQIRTVEAKLPGELDLVLSKLRSFAPRHRN